MWTLGCTIYQLVAGEPLFPEQREKPMVRNGYLLSLMNEHIRKFPVIYTQVGAKVKSFFDKDGKLKQIHGFDLLAETVSLGYLAKDPELMGLLNRCLEYDGQLRPTIVEILDEPWLKNSLKAKSGHTTKQKPKSLSDRLLGIGKGVVLDSRLADDSINNFGEEGESSLVLTMGSPKTTTNKKALQSKRSGGFSVEEDSPPVQTNKALLWSRVDGLLLKDYKDRQKLLSQNMF